MSTIDPAEIRKFEQMAHEWWDPDGKFKPLHQINPIRATYIQQRMSGSPDADLSAVTIADIGCGGGILAESLSKAGANVIAIDRSEEIINVAKTHQVQSGSTVDYRVCSAKELAQEKADGFDAVTCMEVLEHVADITTFLEDCAALVKPGGYLFFATLNRTPKSWFMAILGAEYILNWLPHGTHEYQKFVRPSEVAQMLKPTGIDVIDISGISYSVLSKEWSLSHDPSVNYVGCAVRKSEG